MRKIRYVQIIGILALALAVSTFLPSYISRTQEERLVDQAVTEKAQTVRINRMEKMENKSLLEKFRFLLNGDVEYIEYVPISEGKNLDYKEALDCLYQGVFTLQSFGLVGEIGGIEEYYERADKGINTDGKLYTAANAENPAQSLIVWKFEMLGACSEIYRVTLDDATGAVIGLEVYAPFLPLGKFLPVHYEDAAKSWGIYMGGVDITVNNISYHKVDRKAIAGRMQEESSLARWIESAEGTEQVAFAGDSDALSREPVFDEKGILLDFSYQETADTEVRCVLEWDDCGYRFRLPETIKEKKK